MQIVPRADALIVEAKIAPQDIDQVATGDAVRVRIEAGNRRTTPDLGGVVYDGIARSDPRGGG